MSACPLGLCDGSGFVVDEATNTASDCRCRAGQIAQAAGDRTGGQVTQALSRRIL